MKINGLPLPRLLLDLIGQGRWKRPADTTILNQLTGSEHTDQFEFLNIDRMQQETAASHRLVKDEKLAQIYGLGSSKRTGKPIIAPTILDVDKAILIAMNWDEEVICLDYRTFDDDPRVLVSVLEDRLYARWKVVARDFSSFVKQLGL